MTARIVQSDSVDRHDASDGTTSSPCSGAELQTPVKGILRRSSNASNTMTPPVQSAEGLDSPSSSHNKFFHAGYKGIDDLRARMLAAKLAHTHLDQGLTKEPLKRVTFDEERLVHVREYDRASGTSK